MLSIRIQKSVFCKVNLLYASFKKFSNDIAWARSDKTAGLLASDVEPPQIVPNLKELEAVLVEELKAEEEAVLETPNKPPAPVAEGFEVVAPNKPPLPKDVVAPEVAGVALNKLVEADVEVPKAAGVAPNKLFEAGAVVPEAIDVAPNKLPVPKEGAEADVVVEAALNKLVEADVVTPEATGVAPNEGVAKDAAAVLDKLVETGAVELETADVAPNKPPVPKEGVEADAVKEEVGKALDKLTEAGVVVFEAADEAPEKPVNTGVLELVALNKPPLLAAGAEEVGFPNNPPGVELEAELPKPPAPKERTGAATAALEVIGAPNGLVVETVVLEAVDAAPNKLLVAKDGVGAEVVEETAGNAPNKLVGAGVALLEAADEAPENPVNTVVLGLDAANKPLLLGAGAKEEGFPKEPKVAGLGAEFPKLPVPKEKVEAEDVLEEVVGNPNGLVEDGAAVPEAAGAAAGAVPSRLPARKEGVEPAGVTPNELVEAAVEAPKKPVEVEALVLGVPKELLPPDVNDEEVRLPNKPLDPELEVAVPEAAGVDPNKLEVVEVLALAVPNELLPLVVAGFEVEFPNKPPDPNEAVVFEAAEFAPNKLPLGAVKDEEFPNGLPVVGFGAELPNRPPDPKAGVVLEEVDGAPKALTVAGVLELDAEVLAGLLF